MFWTELLLALAIAIILTLILVPMLGWRTSAGRRFSGAVLSIFGVIFLASWAAGVWVTPVGPMMTGVAVLPFLIMGVITALLVLTLAPPRTKTSANFEEAAQREQAREEADLALSGFFWLLFIGLAILIGVSYFVDVGATMMN